MCSGVGIEGNEEVMNCRVDVLIAVNFCTVLFVFFFLGNC